jgi:L1 cell adhesion molecule like protein
VFRKKHKELEHLEIKESSKRRLRAACERAKRSLSSATSTNIDIECFVGQVDLRVPITRAKFESLCIDFFTKTIERVKGCLLGIEGINADYDTKGRITNLTSSNLEVIRRQKAKIDRVILIGGSSRIPKVRSMLSEFFDGKELDCSVHPDEAVGLGAAYQAALTAADVNFSAADTLLLLDTVPLNISIETAGGVATTIIPKGSSIPLSRSQTFTTYSDYQTAVTINIFEGNRPMVKDNHMIGSFNLDKIPPAPRGVPQIEVICDVNADGILVVSAVDKATANSQKLQVTNTKGRLTEEEIKEMTEEAKRFEEEDRKVLERMNAKNMLEQTVYSTKSAVSSAQLDQAVVDNLLNELKAHEDWLDSNPDATKEEYDSRCNMVRELMTKSMPQSGGYKPSGSGPSPNAGGAGGPSVEEVD